MEGEASGVVGSGCAFVYTHIKHTTHFFSFAVVAAASLPPLPPPPLPPPTTKGCGSRIRHDTKSQQCGHSPRRGLFGTRGGHRRPQARTGVFSARVWLLLLFRARASAAALWGCPARAGAGPGRALFSEAGARFCFWALWGLAARWAAARRQAGGSVSETDSTKRQRQRQVVGSGSSLSPSRAFVWVTSLVAAPKWFSGTHGNGPAAIVSTAFWHTETFPPKDPLPTLRKERSGK
jgi:hypothetical protein